jgi:hypothetical protein
MKFHFAITGHGEAANEIEFVEWLQHMVNEYNKQQRIAARRFNFYHVLVREDVIQD